MAEKSKKKISPSRLEYKRNNPTISARLPLKDRDQFLADLKTAGLPVTNAFEMLAGTLHPKAISLEEARRQGLRKPRSSTRFDTHVNSAKTLS